MSKNITLERYELIWQRRDATWGEGEYNAYLKWLASFENNPDKYWQSRYAEYLFLKEYSWDEVVYFMEHEYEEGIEMPYISHYDYNGEYSYKESIVDLIKDAIREDCYDASVSDEQYADDYNEDWNTLTVEDEEGSENE